MRWAEAREAGTGTWARSGSWRLWRRWPGCASLAPADQRGAADWRLLTCFQTGNKPVRHKLHTKQQRVTKVFYSPVGVRLLVTTLCEANIHVMSRRWQKPHPSPLFNPHVTPTHVFFTQIRFYINQPDLLFVAAEKCRSAMSCFHRGGDGGGVGAWAKILCLTCLGLVFI